jgi:hypothetical protein
MIRQVCYVSTASVPVSDADLQSILEASRRNNGPLGITGLLGYGAGLYLQILEGAPEGVEAIMARIFADTRHRDIRVLHDATVETREFAGCPMAFRTIEAEAAHLISEAHSLAGQPVSQIVVSLGNPDEAAKLAPMRMAA